MVHSIRCRPRLSERWCLEFLLILNRHGQLYSILGCDQDWYVQKHMGARPSIDVLIAAYNWPLHRGTATALPLAAFGLSAFMFTTIANLAFDDSPSNYLLMLAVGTLVLNAVSIIFIRLIPTDTRDDGSEDGRGRSSSRLRYTSERADGHSADAEPTEGDTLVSRASTAEDFGDDEEWTKHSALEEKSVELTGTALLKEFKFWQLFLMLGLLSGVGLMTIKYVYTPVDPSQIRS